ncbi:MAG: hypothetical protein A4S09_00785 [Proteobacteria bacterium SG_bin7]|nr:MAG: hypothetical protein A4S09_00785 [Proteobacteria bacterium SG_bin7]
MNQVQNIAIVIWPVIILLFAQRFHQRQNSSKAWVGGPISWQKSIWLFYTVLTWFLLPFAFLLHSDCPESFKLPLKLHLISWWTRGVLELFMIYRWYNWSPAYGISHDIFHIFLFTSAGLVSGFWSSSLTEGFNLVCLLFGLSIIFSTIAELSFAFLFMRTRSREEEKDNVYFASEDPKWIFINRLTGTVLFVLFFGLLAQSILTLEIF